MSRQNHPARLSGSEGSLFLTCIDNVDTNCKSGVMSNRRSASVEGFQDAAVAVAERPSVSETKRSVNLRIETHTRQLIDDAAAVLGKTRTEFMIDSARSLAIDVLLDQRLFELDSSRYNSFLYALDNPPPPGPRLRALLRRAPAWGR